MPRQKIVDPEELQQDVDVRIGGRGRGRPTKEDSDDPRLPMNVGDVRDDKRSKDAKRITHDSSDTFSIYCRNLVANQGDIVKALAATLHVAEEFATEHMVELHEKMRAASRAGNSLQELMERHDLTREVRIAILREALFHANPAVRLKAVEMLEEVDMTAKAARIGNSWEDVMRMAKEKASKKKK